MIMAGDGPSVLLTSEHVIPVLIEREKKVYYKTDQAQT